MEIQAQAHHKIATLVAFTNSWFGYERPNTQQKCCVFGRFFFRPRTVFLNLKNLNGLLKMQISPVAAAAIQALIQKVFKDQSHVKPILVGRAMGWKDQTSYQHVSEGTFPIDLTPVGKKKLVSLVNYIFWLEAGSPLAKTLTGNELRQQNQKKRGRPSHKVAAAAAAAAKGAV